MAKRKNHDTSFSHPVAGECTLDSRYLAIRWHEGITADVKAALLDTHGLQYAQLASDQPSLLRVNQTDGLSWVRACGDGPLGDDLAAQLEASPSVQWTAPAFVGPDADGAPERMFTVNPKRIYVERAWFERSGGVRTLAPECTLDAGRSERLRGLQALVISGGDTNSMELGKRLQQEAGKAPAAGATGARPVRYETIPFISPTCMLAESPVTAITPDDPMFATQWGLQRIGAPSAWEIARGSSQVTVAVIDEGVQLDHPDLLLSAQSWNASSDLPDGSPTGNHGTACAGIIGARLNNAAGVAGVAGGVRVMAIATATWADVDIAEGLYFAADHGARVVSMSFGVYPSWNMWDFDLIRDALQYAHDRGLLLVAASGNENIAEARFPGSDARTLCVGGSNRSDERKRQGDSSSEPFWGACHGPSVDVVAPCLEIPTTDRLGGLGYSPSDYHDRFNGTSAATPHVAGLAGLMLSYRPSLTAVEVRSIIERTCDKISPALYAYANVAGKPSGTWNDEVGYGRINAEHALMAVRALHADEEAHEGCGGECVESTPAQCRSPRSVPWLPSDSCQFFYERRFFDLGFVADRQRVHIRITYQHCLKLLGRQQGPLLYTTTLLPGESVRVHEFDRYRRVRSSSERVSVHTSFRQTLASLSSSRRASSASAYTDFLSKTRAQSDTSVSAGGGLAGFLGAPSVESNTSFDNETTIASGASVRSVSEQFAQLAVTASQAVDAERSLMVSTFEDEEHRTATVRTLKNSNRCNAITYFVRRVLEVYEASTRIESVEWRLREGDGWRAIDDLQDVQQRDVLRKMFSQLPRQGEVVRDRRQITLPTDGTLYEAELAHCSSCEPVLEAAEKMRLEQLRAATRRANLEVELLALEVQRRRELIASESAPSLSISEWPVAHVAALPANGETRPALGPGISTPELTPAE